MSGLFKKPGSSNADKMVLQNYINGAAVPSSSGQTTDIIDPATGEAYASAPKSNAADIDAAMAAAEAAFVEWKKKIPSERMSTLLKIADALESAKEALADAECKNCGKPRELFLSEVTTRGPALRVAHYSSYMHPQLLR